MLRAACNYWEGHSMPDTVLKVSCALNPSIPAKPYLEMFLIPK